MNGELIRFTKRGEDSYYQREYEQEKHSIDCLDDYYYGMSGVGFHKLAVEDGKINLPCGMEAWLYMAAMDVTQVLTLSCGAII